MELLAPAGNREKAEVAIAYGADAVYVGGKEYSLRAGAGNFSLPELESLVDYAHRAGVRVYVAVNSLLHNEDLVGLEGYLAALEEMGADAVIFSDPAVYVAAKKAAPGLELHFSTQGSLTNWQAIRFWEQMGVRRVILARELSLDEIREVRCRVNLELEVFVHGAMCISYSGRCLLSNYLTGRDANRGDCAQSCRWRYALVEEKRPGQYFPILEDERGSYILNSKDLNMLPYLPELAAAGVDSLKIEGRMKSVYYVATVVWAYRQALDAYHADPDGFSAKREWLEELDKISHRPYTTGFYFGPPGPDAQSYESGGYVRTYDFVGLVEGTQGTVSRIAVRNRISLGERLELVRPKQSPVEFTLEKMLDEEGHPVDESHANRTVFIELPVEAHRYSLLRRRSRG
ncbi:MAG: U32 family peptidase [Firmicutes bacterium]|nr:U32 family peptidase [Bacillota bacterium]